MYDHEKKLFRIIAVSKDSWSKRRETYYVSMRSKNDAVDYVVRHVGSDMTIHSVSKLGVEVSGIMFRSEKKK